MPSPTDLSYSLSDTTSARALDLASVASCDFNDELAQSSGFLHSIRHYKIDFCLLEISVYSKVCITAAGPAFQFKRKSNPFHFLIGPVNRKRSHITRFLHIDKLTLTFNDWRESIRMKWSLNDRERNWQLFGGNGGYCEACFRLIISEGIVNCMRGRERYQKLNDNKQRAHVIARQCRYARHQHCKGILVGSVFPYPTKRALRD